MKYLLDTHAWIWWAMRPEAIPKKVLSLLDNPPAGSTLLLSAISVWEFSKLLEKGRLQIACPGDSWIREALTMPRLELVPLTPAISFQSTILPQPVHDDPADRLIIATARDRDAVLITKDALILNYQHVKALWG